MVGQFRVERDQNRELIQKNEGLKHSSKKASKVNQKAIIALNVHIISMVDEFLTLYKETKT